MILLSLLATYLVLNILNILYIVGSDKAFTVENSFVGLLYYIDELDDTDTFCSVFWKSNLFILWISGGFVVISYMLTTLICNLIDKGWIILAQGVSLLISGGIILVGLVILVYFLEYIKENILNKFKTNKVKEEPKEEIKKPSEKKPNALLSGFKLWYDSIKNKYCPTIKFK